MTYDVATLTRRRLRKTLLIGLTLLLVVVVVVVFVAVAAGGGSDTENGEASAPVVTGEPGGGETTVPQEALNSLTWSDSTGAEVPISTDSGPRFQRDGLATGFAQNPLGAVLAAVHISGNTGASRGPAIFMPTINAQMTGAQLQEFLVATQRDYEQRRLEQNVSSGGPLAARYAVLLGFRIEHYEQEYAAIRLLSREPGPVAEAIQFDFRVEVRWLDGGWKALVPVDQTWNSALTPASNEGYTKFPGRR